MKVTFLQISNKLAKITSRSQTTSKIKLLFRSDFASQHAGCRTFMQVVMVEVNFGGVGLGLGFWGWVGLCQWKDEVAQTTPPSDAHAWSCCWFC